MNREPTQTDCQRSRRKPLLCVVVTVILLAVPPGIQAGSTVIARYVVLAQGDDGAAVPLARAIIPPGRACPVLEVAGQERAMRPRPNPDPEHFPVSVCEARYDFGVEGRLKGTGERLPRVSKAPETVHVFGDSGCKGGRKQDCRNARDWPYAGLVRAALKRSPDLVLHMGDYNYSGTPRKIDIDGRPVKVYDAGDGDPTGKSCAIPHRILGQDTEGSSRPDNWADWNENFFEPAAPLLEAAPWIVVRGNHELCSRAGRGWFYFLAPASSLLGDSERAAACPAGDSPADLVFSPPYRVELDTVQFVVLDSVNACDDGDNYSDRYARQLRQVFSSTANKSTWVLSHRPFWGVRLLDGAPVKASAPPQDRREIVNRTLQLAAAKAFGGTWPDTVELVLSGHMHRFEALGFDGARPPQLIVGNSGVKLEPVRMSPDFRAQLDGMTTNVLALGRFGFMHLDLDPGQGWSGSLVDERGDVLAVCAPPAAPANTLCRSPLNPGGNEDQ